ncbi:Cyclic nucleotide-binding domain protein [Alloalcanivorax dieselolei B5]|uniref:Cyclic nucleotide-binding domain protein n=1 Tax=Alcanivorax dieselolei (strain DSM 16502 / CGMCC 1.3690 / MCCC 1A00001 / B-5) TaxID=930169 RepID=K0CE16_ALCDB|nr:cyclic nucleotide-binding domain-containing protein [Alloalcanivorax dieselolei]AFT71854.1 Cyclic nucleotide-binding domain protein [Alloalcanivorax dieselolei B5]GGK01985.1 hypothetical protein GCM10007426_33780 [Alloalcanivorax dieselolei]
MPSIPLSQLLSHMRLFDGLEAEELAVVEKLVFVNRVNAGETACREGDHSDFVCFVASGRLDIIKHHAEQGEVVIAQLKPGDSLGEMALVDQQPRSATVRAVEDSALVVLTRKGFEQLRRRRPRAAAVIMENIASLLCSHLRQTSSRLARFMLPLG